MLMRKMGSKGSIPEQIPVNFIIVLAMFAMGAGVLLLMIGRWLDITGIKYKVETQRNAMNLLQLLVSNSPVVKRDPTDMPLKLILDAEKLDEYQTYAAIGTETPSIQRDNWEKCCDFLDFDYNFTVYNLVTDDSWTITNLIFDSTSECYPQRVTGLSDLPVVIEQEGRRDYGVATIEMIRTPLSELSFWLSQAFTRASWDEYWSIYSPEPYYVEIPLGPDIVCLKFVDTDCADNYGRVCVVLADGREACKNYVCVNGITFDEDWNNEFTGDCFKVLISASDSGSEKVGIIYPGNCP